MRDDVTVVGSRSEAAMSPQGDSPGQSGRREAPTSAVAKRRGIGIGLKLGLLISGLQIAIVGCLALYFQVRQVDALRGELRSKAGTYAQLVGAQVRSAVAFDDRETAR